MKRSARQIPFRDLRTVGASRAPRWAEYDYVGDANVHLTICADRETPFGDAAFARVVAESIEKCSALCRHRLFGFCVMPDHVHVLLSPGTSGVAVADWLRRFKSFTTNVFIKRGGKSPLWQRSAYDHVCREAETAETVLTYIVNNPVRRGLAERWQDWPWTKVFIEI